MLLVLFQDVFGLPHCSGIDQTRYLLFVIRAYTSVVYSTLLQVNNSQRLSEKDFYAEFEPQA